MARYFIEVGYNGTDLCGFQIQDGQETVQSVVSAALQTVFKEPVALTGSSRTDAGVHAKQNFFHFDTELVIPAKHIYSLNAILPPTVVVHNIYAVAPEAHARFDASQRTYEYHINRFKDVFGTDGSWYYPQNLNVDLMNLAAAELKNYTDFECFSKVNTDVNTFNCDIFVAYWKQENDHLIITISANRFLRNMVRAIVGTLINVGLEKLTLDDFKAIIESKDRNKAGFSVPAHGLYLTQITYAYL